jgi:hypothetical protein
MLPSLLNLVLLPVLLWRPVLQNLCVCVAQQAVQLADQWLQTVCTQHSMAQHTSQHGMVRCGDGGPCAASTSNKPYTTLRYYWLPTPDFSAPHTPKAHLWFSGSVGQGDLPTAAKVVQLGWQFSLVIYPGSTPVGNATLVVANVLTCNKYSPKKHVCVSKHARHQLL